LIDRRLDEYIQALETELPKARPDEAMYLEKRLASLQQSKAFTKLHGEALGIIDKQLLGNIQTAEAMRTSLMAMRLNANTSNQSKMSELKQTMTEMLQHLPRTESIGE